MLRLPLIDPIAIYLGPLQIPWVGLLYLAGFVLAGRQGRSWANGRPAAGVTAEEWEGVLTWGALGAVVLGRFAARRIDLVGGTPGLAFHVGLAGALLASAVFAWSRKRPWWPMADLLALAAPVFLAVHNLGSLIDQTGWGLPTGLPWGMRFASVGGEPRHPVALYGLALQGVALFWVLRAYATRGLASGMVFALFLVGFGLSESLLAFMQGPAPFEVQQWIGLVVMVAGLLMLIKRSDCQVATSAGNNAAVAVESAVAAPADSARRFPVSVLGMLAVAAIAGLATWSHVSHPTPRAVAALAQASFPDLGGVRQPLNQWRGRTVVLNFWATWCPPCRQEIPLLEAAQRQYARQGLMVIGVALDDAGAVRTFARQYQINYPILVAGNSGNTLAKQLGDHLGVVPYTVVLDGQGRVTATQTGEINRARLQSLVAPLLKQQNPG